MTRPLVTVITGNSNCGSACIKELFANYASKVRVRGVFRSEDKAAQFRKMFPDLEVVSNVDASQPETLANAFKGAQSAFIVHPLDATSLDFVKDAQYSLNMINSAVENGIKNIVYVGSVSVLDPIKLSLIAARFIPSEELLKKLHEEKKIKYTVLRCTMFMDNYKRYFETIKSESSFTFPNIQTPLVDTKDVGKCAALCLACETDEHDAKCYLICGPQVMTPQEVAEVFTRVLGKKVTHIELKKETFKALPPAICQAYTNIVDTKCIISGGDLPQLIGQLGTFEQFVRDHLHYFETDKQ